MADVVFVRGSRLFDFKGMEHAVSDEQAVELLAVLVPVEIERGLHAVVPPAAQDFADDPRFEDGPGHGPGLQRLRGRPARQIGDQPGIQKIELGGLHQPLGHVAVPRLEEPDQARGFQHGQPVFRRIRMHVRVPGQLGHVQQLPGPGGAGPQKTEEGQLVPDLRQIPDVALQIGLDIRTVEKLVRGFVDALPHQRGVAPRPDVPVRVGKGQEGRLRIRRL